MTVKVDYLREWYRDGLLCIGDAAHAMSPVGGVGINLAIQDAVATANLLGKKLAAGRVGTGDLKAVQMRRERPARLTQRVQIFIHEHLLEAIKLNLELEGYKVSTATNGKKALQIFKEERFNLVILDVMMPEIDGFVAQVGNALLAVGLQPRQGAGRRLGAHRRREARRM